MNSPSSVERISEHVVATAKQMAKEGLVVGSEGNLSARIKDTRTVAITPSAMPYAQMEPQDIVLVDLDGSVIKGSREPSSETKMHLAIYHRRKNVGAVMHTHSPQASALAVLHKPIPPLIDEQVLTLGGDVPVVGYSTPGSDELAAKAAEILAHRDAALLANHGVVSCGRDLSDALRKAMIVERLAKTYVTALLMGRPVPLPKESMDRFRQAYERESERE